MKLSERIVKTEKNLLEMARGGGLYAANQGDVANLAEGMLCIMEMIKVTKESVHKNHELIVKAQGE